MGSLVDFALKSRFLVLILAVLLFAWGIVSFRALPVEAYPDVANNYVQIITQWPGRAAEEVEQQVTVPVEIQMNGIPHLKNLRSTSLAGLSSVMLIFDDESINDWNREKVLERIAQVTLPTGLTPQIGTDWSPVGQIYWYTLVSKNPSYDNMALKSLEDWTLEKQFKSVQGVVDVSSFGGITREYQVQLDPNKLISYGLTIAQVEQQLTNNNVNGGGSFIEEGQQSINVRAVGLFSNVDDIANTLIKTTNGTALHVRDIATVVQGAKIRLGQTGKAIRRKDGVVVDDSDTIEGVVLLQKGANSDEVLEGIHAKVIELNGIEAQSAESGGFFKGGALYKSARRATAAKAGLLPPGVKVVPFLDRDDLVHLTTHTVLHNLTEGIILVMIILFLFLGNVRGALIVALTIPFSLLFASICLNLQHIPANLLSLGALDFGMVVDGAVVMVENIVRHMNRKHDEPRTTIDIVREAAHEVQRPVFYAIGIIVTAYLPIFTLQQVEGRLFRPMAWTVAFALLGALVFSMFLAPVLSSFLFKNGAKEWHNPVMDFLTRYYRSAALWAVESRWIVVGATLAGLAFAVILTEGGAIGSEFLPHLDEGAIWVRGTLAPSTGPTEGIRVMAAARPVLANFPEVKDVISQVGRPDDGVDTTGFFDTEYFVDLREKREWRPVFNRNKEELISAMNRELVKMPGVLWNFSQPISDNMEEAVSGVKGELAVKIYGDDLKTLEKKGDEIVGVMSKIQGIQDLGLFRVIGQPNLNFVVDRTAAARYGINVSDVQDAIQTAVGGNAVTQVLDKEARYDVALRYAQQYRSSEEAIEQVRLVTPFGQRVSLAQLTKPTVVDGASEIYREGNSRYVAIKYSVRGRDLGGAVEEAIGKVTDQVKLPVGYSLSWAGEYESQKRSAKRLAIVVPITIFIIFFILYMMFGSLKWSMLIMANVIIAPIGGTLALFVTHTNFSVSSGVGFLALFGVSVQTGVIMLEYINQMRVRGHSIEESAVDGAVLRLRPIMMTMLVATLGLLPAATSHGIGSDSQRPFAVVIVGGLLMDLVISLFLLPTLYVWFAGPDDILPAPEGEFD